MGAVATLFYGTVEESLKKLLQPSGLLPAALLVLLNLGFVYPTAKEDKWRVATAFGSIGDTWKIVVAGAVVLSLGYLLLHGSTLILDALAGRTWRGSFAHDLLMTRQLRKWDRAESAASTGPLPKLLFLTRYPPRADVQATGIGNSLSASQAVVAARYGAELAAVWPQMQSAAEADSRAFSVANDEKVALDLLGNLTFVLLFFAFEAAAVFSLGGHWNDVLLALVPFALALLAYRVMAEKARSWGTAIEVLFDFHRADLKKGMGLRKTTGADDENLLLADLSHFLFGGRDPGDRSAIFDAPIPRAPLLKSSSNVTAKFLTNAISEGPLEPDTPAPASLRFIHHVISVTRPEADGDPVDADVYVVEPRARAIGAELPDCDEPGGASAAATVDPGVPAEILWEVVSLPAGGSITLDYELPLWTLHISPASTTAAVTYLPAVGHEVTISLAAGAAEAIIEVTRFSAINESPTLHGEGVTRLTSSSNVYRWSVTSIDWPQTLIVELPEEAAG